jgi:hypothetical protein
MMPRINNVVFDYKERPMEILSRKDIEDGNIQLTVKYLPEKADYHFTKERHDTEMRIERLLDKEGYILLGWRYVRGAYPAARDLEAYYLKNQGPRWVYAISYKECRFWVHYGTKHQHEDRTYLPKRGGILRLSKKEALSRAQEVTGENHYSNYFKPCDSFWLLSDGPDMRPLYLTGSSPVEQEREAAHA